MNKLLERFLAGIQAGAREVLVPVASACVRQRLPKMRNDSGGRSMVRAGKWNGLPGSCFSTNHPQERQNGAGLQQRGETMGSDWNPRGERSERNRNVLGKDAESQ